MSSTLFFYLLVEIALMIILIRKFKTPNALVLGYFLFFIYAQSTYINYLLSGINYIQFNSFNSLDFYLNSDSYFKASTYFFIFMLTYGCLGIFIKFKDLFSGNEIKEKIHVNSRLKALIFFISGFILLYHLQSLGMDRVDKKQYSLLPFDFVIFYIAYYLWSLLFLYSNIRKVPFYILTFIVLFHSVYSFEREYIVFIGLAFLFKYKRYFRGSRLLIISSIGFLVLTYWKQFYLHVVISSRPLSTFFEELTFDLQLSSSDSVVGMSLLTQYFENDIYGDYYLSYVTNTYSQFVRMFFNTGYKSIAEYTTNYYTYGTMGTAFSMILESILNFGILGPFLLPIFIIKGIVKTLKKKFLVYDFYSIFLVFMLIKLVRTEFTVMIKLYLMPFIIFVLLMKFFYKKEVKII